MRKLHIAAITIGSVLLLLIGSGSATVFNDGAQISHADYQIFSPSFGGLPEDNVQRIYVETAKNLDPWKVVLWFGLWVIALFLWASIPVTKDEDQE